MLNGTIAKEVNNKNLKHVIMQLRKVCQHPYLFHWPKDPDTREPLLTQELINASGKMMVLERLLDELFKRGHKVLLFSQFTTMLDIIEVCVLPMKCELHNSNLGYQGLGD